MGRPKKGPCLGLLSPGQGCPFGSWGSTDLGQQLQHQRAINESCCYLATKVKNTAGGHHPARTRPPGSGLKGPDWVGVMRHWHTRPRSATVYTSGPENLCPWLECSTECVGSAQTGGRVRGGRCSPWRSKSLCRSGMRTALRAFAKARYCLKPPGEFTNN